MRTHAFSEFHVCRRNDLCCSFSLVIGTWVLLKVYCGIVADSLAIYTRKKCVINTAIVSFRLPPHEALVNLHTRTQQRRQLHKCIEAVLMPFGSQHINHHYITHTTTSYTKLHTVRKYISVSCGRWHLAVSRIRFGNNAAYIMCKCLYMRGV